MIYKIYFNTSSKILRKVGDFNIINGEANVDNISFFIPRYYNNLDLKDMTFKMRYMLADRIEQEMTLNEYFDREEEDSLVFTIPINKDFYGNSGIFTLFLIVQQEEEYVLMSEITDIRIKENNLKAHGYKPPSDWSQILEDYLKKNELAEILNGYQPKLTDDDIKNIIKKVDFSNYYNKSEIDKKINEIIEMIKNLPAGGNSADAFYQKIYGGGNING